MALGFEANHLAKGLVAKTLAVSLRVSVQFRTCPTVCLTTVANLARGYSGRILMLKLLAPDIVEAIMDGRQPAELGGHVRREWFPVEWGEQRKHLCPNRQSVWTSLQPSVLECGGSNDRVLTESIIILR